MADLPSLPLLPPRDADGLRQTAGPWQSWLQCAARCGALSLSALDSEPCSRCGAVGERNLVVGRLITTHLSVWWKPWTWWSKRTVVELRDGDGGSDGR